MHQNTPSLLPCSSRSGQAGPGEFELHQYRADISRYITRLGVPQRMVEEITQDTFLIAFTRRCDFAGRSTQRTWLFGIAFHLVRNWRRRRSNHERYEERWFGTAGTDAEGGWSEMTTEASAFDDALVSQICARVGQALDALPEEERRLWLMVTFEEAPVAVAARRLGLREDDAHGLVAKAHRHVKHAVLRQRRTNGTTRSPNATPRTHWPSAQSQLRRMDGGASTTTPVGLTD